MTGGAARTQSPPSAVGDGYKKVLVLYSTRRDAPYTIAVENVLRETIRNGLVGRLDYYTEYFDFSRFAGSGYDNAIRTFLREKYAKLRPDVVISDGGISFAFLARHRAELFPDVPLVFSTEQTDFHRVPNSSGVVYSLDMKSTLDMALRLHPAAKHVFVITGASEFDRFYERIARQQFREYETRVGIEYLTPTTLEALHRRVATLPAESIIYFASFFADGAGQKFIPMDLIPELSSVANAPMYCWPEMTLGLGVVGGVLLSEQAVARQTASVALRVLRGESPDSIPTLEIRPYVRAFDWRQLQRWRLSEGRLPPGSVVQFQQQSLWSVYRWRIIAAASLLAAQALLIVGLIVNRVRRERAERALRSSHNRIEDLAHRLIVAQEEERKHLARELHDDVSQQVTALTIDLAALKRQLSGSEPSLQDDVAMLQDSAGKLAERVHGLSHDLHATTLEHVGLVASIRAYCDEFSKREGIAVTPEIHEVAGPVTPDASLCLFRVMQEALRNAARHSGATRIDVELDGSDEYIELRVADHGRGFDQRRAAERGGLGLASMEERVKLTGGTLHLQTQSGAGTRLTARVPRHHETAVVA
jgi:signal transduction histidine kinase